MVMQNRNMRKIFNVNKASDHIIIKRLYLSQEEQAVNT